VTLIPQYPLYTNTSYRVEVLAGAKAPRALASNARLAAPFSSTFTTSLTPSSTAAPFETAATDPEDGETGVSTDASLTVTFTASIDPRSVSAKAVKLFGPTGNKVKLAKVPVIAEDGKSFSWQPLAPLATSTSYRLTLKGGKKGVRGASGQPMPNSAEVSFSTSPVAATSQMELGISG
jgi:hypothetical protein